MPSNKYLEQLLHFANTELPLLNYDVQNASTLFTQQDCLKRMHNMITYLVHTAVLGIYEAHGNGAPSQVAKPAPPPVVRAPAPKQYGLPPIDAAPVPENESQAAEVFVTPQGAKVVLPGRPAAMFPVGATVDVASLVAPQQQRTAPAMEPFPPFIQSPDVVLPQGGGMTPEVAAALAGRSSGPPMMDATGGARNITHDPAP